MKNPMTRKKSFIVFILAAALAIVLSSCSSGNEEYSQELQNQVSALQTQNALLQENLNSQELQNQVSALQTQNALLQENLNSQENQEDVPEPPTNEEPDAELLLQTPTPEFLPTEPVPAGQPIVYGGWSMMVSKELNINEDKNLWGIDIYVRNLGETNRIFRFTNSAITAKDNLGNVYEPSPIVNIYGWDRKSEKYYYQIKNLEIKGLSSHTISSGDYGRDSDEDGIGMFVGPIPLEAGHLIIHFDGFGPFTNVDVIIDL